MVERALSRLVPSFPRNKLFEDVLLKVVVINDLYRTGILATYKVAGHIAQLDIDPILEQGSPEAVDLVARVQIGDKTRNNYSFATKFCAWHNPEAYPIYDSFVDQVLWGYRAQDHFATFQRQDLRQYARFREVITVFREHYGLSGFSLKDIDKFLWLAGKQFYPATWDKASK